MSDPLPLDEPQRFIFLDRGGKRWPRLRRLIVLFGALIFIAFILFVQSLLVKPELQLPASVRKLKGQLKALQQKNPAAQPGPLDQGWQKYYPSSLASQEHLAKLREQLKSHPHKSFSEVRLGFYANWDENAYNSLLNYADRLTHVCPEWMTLADVNGTLRVDEDVRVERIAAAKGLILMPLLNNLVEDVWQPEAVESLINGPPDRRNRFIIELLSHLDEIKAGGVVVDWEEIDPAYKDKYSDLLEKMAAALHAVDKQLWLIVPMGDEIKMFDLERLANSVDRFIAMLHDENSEVDAPGPIASQDWFEGWLQVINGQSDPEQWIAAIGAYGYDWTAGSGKAETITFEDAMSRASYAGVDKVNVQSPSYNPTYSYSEPQGDHTVWFLDAVTFLNQLRDVREAELGGIAIYRLGTEDPQIWDVLGMRDVSNPAPGLLARLTRLKTADTVTNVGRGEIVTVDDSQEDGSRTVAQEANRRFVSTYTAFPTYPILYHQGYGGEHQVALTFDDGPDPTWTPQVLDILKQRGVKAAFFLVGRQAEQYPNLVKRIIAEGHEIGNHTYFHTNLAEDSAQEVRLELNATQRLIESITGLSTTLCRPPYNADSRPTSLHELKPLKLIQDELGYLIVLENIDPEDWARPGSDLILQRIKDQRRLGSIILLHDAGGNRQQTVDALPKIIDYLQTRGDQIVSLSKLINIPRDDLMPPLKKNAEPIARFITALVFRVSHATEEFVWAFMIAATILIVLRTLLVGILASLHHRKFVPVEEVGFHPPISILIAAYNEAKVIQATLRSVTETDYPGDFEVIVVDDGSVDGTAAEVEKAASLDKRIRLFRQPNSGKAKALETALAHASNDVLVFLDADTHFECTTLTQLVQPLQEPAVGAVSGHAKVGNLRTFIARFQSLEYICGFNLDRRAYALWDCITVAPGAVSAIRKTALAEAGGFSLDTLAEDTDLTLSLHKAGYRVDYVPDAIAWTEAPETFRTLARQRFRWAFGTLQCLWKHRDLVFNPQYKGLGWFSLPSIWFFQILLVAITPIVDTVLILSLFVGGGAGLWAYAIIFLLMDVVLALMACGMDGEKLRKAWTIIPMRIVYRPLLSWVIWRAILRAIKGALVTWGKNRTHSLHPDPRLNHGNQGSSNLAFIGHPSVSAAGLFT